ncbi:MULTISPECIES: 16S rRNA (guanine(966)-N(2))-methyltransferase RsmD [Photobacterium]|uniref:Ribosomal RNA small subunit methyltransferase D n=1 Tax=Photobacterium halotolerans TaxID=265726 RepID=A0A0F5VDF9_9GAMM|nr:MULTISPECIES: 16S rRNA (guanine(966)-N(2))-methyltransferase RsmD [Photobacterium]KKD00149.1 16S rRNA methyltransferase [Photobacterium halotolerans]UIP28044.1 16S rRNA (guanine(966)-N(2))-methyltransferase RsmD [Photobacterium sp. TLY01]
MTRRKTHSGHKAHPPSQAGFVRIISGRWRGRKLPVHDVAGLRPTTDRVKETVFNWLAPDIHGARCLDLFAGSGSLGLEALSRGADHLTLLELDSKAASQLKRNLDTLGTDKAELHQADSLAFLRQPGSAYDLVFIDPPFRRDMLPEVIHLLETNGWLTPQALIYLEAEKELGQPETPEHWQLIKEKAAGQVCYRLYQREEI